MRKLLLLSVVAAVAVVCSRGSGEPHATKAEEKNAPIYRPGDVKWTDGPASLPPGAKAAILEGNPATKGLFVMRVRLPDGYRVPPHTHTEAERVTVISGIFHIGMGDKFDVSKGHTMPAGSYGSWPAGMKHYAWAEGETVIQVVGMGPWSITYVNPEDDPRKAPK